MLSNNTFEFISSAPANDVARQTAISETPPVHPAGRVASPGSSPPLPAPLPPGSDPLTVVDLSIDQLSAAITAPLPGLSAAITAPLPPELLAELSDSDVDIESIASDDTGRTLPVADSFDPPPPPYSPRVPPGSPSPSSVSSEGDPSDRSFQRRYVDAIIAAFGDFLDEYSPQNEVMLTTDLVSELFGHEYDFHFDYAMLIKGFSHFLGLMTLDILSDGTLPAPLPLPVNGFLLWCVMDVYTSRFVPREIFTPYLVYDGQVRCYRWNLDKLKRDFRSFNEVMAYADFCLR